MTKEQFLSAVCARLQNVSALDRQRTLDYYSEMIDDRIEDGMSEQEAVAAMGDIDEAVGQLPHENERSGAGRAVALGVTSPVWAPLCIGLFTIMWSVVVALYAAVVGVGVGVSALTALCLRYLFTTELAQALLFFGSSLVCVGVMLLLGVAAGFVARFVVFLTKKIWRAVFR